MKGRLTKEAKRKLNSIYASISYYKRYSTFKGLCKIYQLRNEAEKIRADKRNYQDIPTEEEERVKNEIISVRAQIWVIDNRYPHRQERRHYLKNRLDQLLNAG